MAKILAKTMCLFIFLVFSSSSWLQSFAFMNRDGIIEISLV